MSGERNLRPCRFNDKNYLFHCWGHEAYVLEPSILAGGHPGGQMSTTFSLVEDESGKVYRVDAHRVQFLDNLYKEYEEKEAFQ